MYSDQPLIQYFHHQYWFEKFFATPAAQRAVLEPEDTSVVELRDSAIDIDGVEIKLHR